MSGYKRVSFYELCRLCASNTQKEKTHIFQEEGKKIQLQNKIQVCLALTVNENDFLPKVVCSKCLRSLETCYGFRQECVSSETMLSSYFKNFRYTDDFKKSGKVYIKDIKQPSAPVIQQNPEISTSSTPNVGTPISVAQTMPQNIVNVNKNPQAVEQLPFYTLQLPTIVSNPNIISRSPKDLVNNKTTQITQSQFAYNLNLINTSNIKSSLPKNEILSNVVVNSNGEVINIAHMGDFETILNQGSVLKPKHKVKRHKEVPSLPDDVVQIDLTNDHSPVYELDQNTIKYDKLPHIKSTQNQNKYSYTVKVDDKNHNQTVIFPLSEYNQNFNNFNNGSSIYTQPNLNIVNTTNTIGNTNVICNTASTLDTSNLGVNLLNQTVQDFNQTAYTNVISSIQQPEMSKVESQSQIPEADIKPTNGSMSPPSISSNSPQKSHVCEVCSRAFKRREHLYQHVKLHTGFRPYICEHCNKAFMRKEHLIRHSTLHSGQKNYTCNICDKSFSRNDNLLKHKKTHEKQASYTCEICQKQFVMKHYYNAHKLTHGDKCFMAPEWEMLKT
ncbi:unnamed protein product [Phaedon cochleariae]|uniref:Zinc finger protein n=1 Tax=Phaedon cochleariae TaxID=80249 RepID=A0A9P0DAM6_PHACE|nr:unnamed protein product [Phaedon cochleariae]